MANIQKYAEQFDEAIRLKRFDENKVLREKRDAVLNRLRDRFAARRKEGEKIPTFSEFNQGSYQMGTGIQPAKGDYDIDVGLRFNCAKEDYANPVDLKVLVADALEDHTKTGTKVRRCCVTVYYKKDGEQAYHVDLAIYAYDNPDSDDKKLFLAKGKRGSDEGSRSWEPSDPMGLMEWVEGRFSDSDDEKQFLRVVRALKRWKSERFSDGGNNAPGGVGLTVAAGHWFRPQIKRDTFAKTTAFDDVQAMRSLVDAIINNFHVVGLDTDRKAVYRLRVNIPVTPKTDTFERMSDGQMTTFRERLIQLRDSLDEAIAEADPVEACKIMRKQFGEEFPVPEKQETAQSRGRAITSSGVSA